MHCLLSRQGGSAVALNSTANGRLLLNALRERPTNHPLLLCLDSDRSGREACDNLVKQLHAGWSGFPGTSARTSAVRRGTQTSRCRQTSRGSLSLFKVLKRKQ